MKLHLPLGGFKAFILIAFIFFGLSDGFGQCPGAPSPATYDIIANSNTAISVNSGQNMVIRSGATYTGQINNLAIGSTIYVYPGGSFKPSGLSNFGGKIVNCGIADLPFTNYDIDDATIENYSIMVAGVGGGSYNFNKRNIWLNGLDATMTFPKSLTMDRTTFTNNGNVYFKGITMNSATVINNDSMIADGNMTLGGTIDNKGLLFALGSQLTINSGGNITNGCYFVSDADFNYSGSDPMVVTGFIWQTGKTDLNLRVREIV